MHSDMSKPRVGIIKSCSSLPRTQGHVSTKDTGTHQDRHGSRASVPGGIQTCCLELCAGLNRLGIIPDILWDEPTDWGAFSDPTPEFGFSQGRLPISSAGLRSLPAWLMHRLRPLSVRFAKLGLERYDFVYSFEPHVRMPASPPNVCFLAGPSHLNLPDPMGDEDGRRALSPLRAFTARYLRPRRLIPDPNARYVTQADWIAELLLKTRGIHVPVVWPPARLRNIEASSSRSGFLFLSRLCQPKRPHVMLALARRFPKIRFTIAGVSYTPDAPYVSAISASAQLETPGNVRIIADPSDKEISHLFAEHEFFVFPARWEHFGIVTVEAILAGLIPLVHDSGGQREVVPLDALRFKGDTEVVEKAAALLSTSQSERRDMLENLQRHVARGSPKNYCKEMISFLCRDLGLAYP